MSRPTADIVADLRAKFDSVDGYELDREAADRLAELDAVDRMRTELAKGRDALRPVCPTCGGTGHVCDHGITDCECDTWGMPFERMAAIVNAVFALDDPDTFAEPRGLRDYLRSVKP